MTAKKQPAPTFMARVMQPTAAVPSAADPAPITVTIPEIAPLLQGGGLVAAPIPAAPTGPWYKAVLERFPCDPEQRLFLTERIASALSWGGDDHMIKVPQGLLMALLGELRRDHIVQQVPAA